MHYFEINFKVSYGICNSSKEWPKPLGLASGFATALSMFDKLYKVKNTITGDLVSFNY